MPGIILPMRTGHVEREGNPLLSRELVTEGLDA
jgi:hypothetical protein